ncbi:MAG TPA: hypothetical protein VOA87_02165 [Thermoanaerobaculia bacterium]|nr:hypothetical protein [Thermoanaerobaculia bacterium]
MATEAVSRTDLEQLQATAWAMARILGATFTDKCWDELSREIAAGIGMPVPTKDQTAFNAYGLARRRLFEIRLALLIHMMLEEAFERNASTLELIVLHEAYLRSALRREICLWPFWTQGC